MFAPDGTVRDIHQLGQIFEPGSIHPVLLFHVKYLLRKGKKTDFVMSSTLVLLLFSSYPSVSFLLLVLLHFNGPFLPRRERKDDHQSRDSSPFPLGLPIPSKVTNSVNFAKQTFCRSVMATKKTEPPKSNDLFPPKIESQL